MLVSGYASGPSGESEQTRRTTQSRPDIRTQPTSSHNDTNSSCYPGGIHIRNDCQERGVYVDHSSVSRWAIKFLPMLEKIFRKYKRPVGVSWHMDETYIKVNGSGSTCIVLLTRKGPPSIFYCRPSEIQQRRAGFSRRRCAKTGIQRRSRWTKVAPTKRPWTGSTKIETCLLRCARSSTSTTSSSKIIGS